MAGSLVLIQETTVSSATASVSLVGIDSTFNVYKVVYDNVQCDTDAQNFRIRVTKSGSADTTSNYDYAYKDLKAYSSFANVSSTNQGRLNVGYFGTGTSETFNSIIHLYNFNSSSEYSFGTTEDTNGNSAYDLKGQQGGFVHTVASASDGLYFYMSSGNIASGTFTLYKVV